MADLDLQLRSRQAATGGPAAQAALLVARIRSGELRGDFVRVLAYAGHEASRLVFPDERDPLVEAVRTKILWDRLENLGCMEFVRPCTQSHANNMRTTMWGWEEWANTCCLDGHIRFQMSRARWLWVSAICAAVEAAIPLWKGDPDRKGYSVCLDHSECFDCGTPGRTLAIGRNWLARPTDAEGPDRLRWTHQDWDGPHKGFFADSIYRAMTQSGVYACPSLWDKNIGCLKYLGPKLLTSILLADLARNLLGE